MKSERQDYKVGLLDSTSLLDHLSSNDLESHDYSAKKNLGHHRSKGNSKIWSLVAACFFIFLAIATWISEIELTRYILESNSHQSGYNNPYAMMWMAHNLYIPFGFGMSLLLSSFSRSEAHESDLQSQSSHGHRTWDSIVSRATPDM